jgi:S1-C subfamily serine protease
MAVMAFVDVIIVLLLIGALARGVELGFVRQLLSTAGFFGGLLLGAFIEPHTIHLAHTPGTRILVTLASTLGTAFIVLLITELLGMRLKMELLFREELNRFDNALGASIAVISSLALVWLSAAALSALPYPELQAGIHKSKIITRLNGSLPPAPSLIADIGHLIAPNGFPNVFIGGEPNASTAESPTPAELANAVTKDKASVVKIQGEGCGGIVEGSGFVVGANLVATNAHVVAGINQPYVTDEKGTRRATPIWFDPDLDFAVLEVNQLAGPALTFRSDDIAHGTKGGVLGYPGGGPFTADVAAILEEFTAVGRNIYNEGRTTRYVYMVQATVVPGNSGGPLVDLNGDVMGVVFAASVSHDGTGYVLSTPQVLEEINQARASDTPVSTGACAE